MYIPKHFLEQDGKQLAEFIDQNGFGILVTMADGKPFASHIPFLYDQDLNVLRGHVARANPQWKHFSDSEQVLVIFQGPHTYVSPSWYVSPGVPTWNYAVTHVYGLAAAVEEPASVEQIVRALTKKYERRNAPPWVAEYDPRMLQAIVGIEVRIKDIQGKFKLSQNRSAADHTAVVNKLAASDDRNDNAVASLMKSIAGRY